MKNTRLFKFIATVLTVTLCTALLIGCGCGKEDKKTTSTKNTKTESTKENTTDKDVTTTKSVEDAVTTTTTTVATQQQTNAATTQAQTTKATTTAQSTQAKPSYTFTDMNAVKYAKSSVNVRNLPCADGSKVGSLTANQEVSVTGQCNETGWYRINYNNGVAYVSNNYLVDTKAVPQTTTKPNVPATTVAQTPTTTKAQAQGSELERVYGVTLPATATVNVEETFMFIGPSVGSGYVTVNPAEYEKYTSGQYGTWGLDRPVVNRVFKGETVTVHQFSGTTTYGWAYVTDSCGITGWIAADSGRLAF